MPTKRDYLDRIAEDYRNGWIAVGCIPAPGFRDKYGYGRVKVDGSPTPASNYALRQAVGPPPPDKPEAAHTCPSKGCCNPAHLSWKSAKGNAADRKRDGTENTGERHGSAKLTADDVLEIRRLHATGGYTYRKLADMYGVAFTTIGEIVRREIWTHI